MVLPFSSHMLDFSVSRLNHIAACCNAKKLNILPKCMYWFHVIV